MPLKIAKSTLKQAWRCSLEHPTKPVHLDPCMKRLEIPARAQTEADKINVMSHCSTLAVATGATT